MKISRAMIRAFLLPVLAAAGVLLCSAQAASAERLIARRLPTRVASSRLGNAAKPPPLVNADDELAGFLAQAEELIDRKAYDRAIDIIQALIDRPDSGFVSGPDGRQYVSLWLKANELLGRMDPTGVKRYRRRFNPSAQRLYERAVAQSDNAGLRRVVQRYLWSDYGVLGLEALAHLAFDRGRFIQAGGFWRQALRIRRGTEAEPLLLAKVAVACHLAGEAAAAERLQADLKKRHPQAKAMVAGAEQRLVAFLERAMRMPAPPRVGPRRQLRGWPGQGGIPDGMGIMTDSDVVLKPVWRIPPPDPQASGESKTLKLLVGSGLLSRYTPNLLLIAQPKRGHIHVAVQVRRGSSSQRSGGFYLPSLLHPAVVDDTVICRQDDAIWAYDLLTGQEKWRSATLPLERKGGQPNARHITSSRGVPVGESGQYGLTVGGGKAYALYHYTPPQVYQRHPFGGRNVPRQPADSSSMAAIYLDREGKLAWKVGGGSGDEDVVRNGKFLTPPTYHGGRVYAVSLYLEAYYLVCLDADNGDHVWSSMIAQTPAVPRRYGYPTGHWFARGSPPAVADGMVFGLTNSGAVGAFEAETGRPIWAYQYDSTVNTPYGPRSYSSTITRAAMPTNPMIVTGGRLICLPADSTRAFALSVENGQQLWQAERGQHRFLNAIDEGRALLSGRGLLVLSTATGEEVFGRPEPEILARPAVTDKAILASTEDAIIRVQLDNYALETTQRDHVQGLLGNLVSVDGKLIAANASGLCAYFDYKFARVALSQRLAKADPADQWNLRFQRAQMAFNAKEFASALEDLQACWALSARDRAGRLKLQPWRLRTYVALANRAAELDQMIDLFRKAESCASTDREKAHLKVRIAKYHEKAGQYAQAAALAHRIAVEFGRLEIADVPIGPSSDDTNRFGPKTEKYPAEEWAMGKDGRGGFIGELIRKHGQKIYEALDALAKEAFEQARGKQDSDALVEVARKWPHSEWADDARFLAAEIWYKKATATASPQQANELLLRKVVPRLEEVAIMEDSPLRVSAAVALAAIYARGGRKLSAGHELNPVRDEPPETPVAFGDIKGTLGQLIQEIEGGELPTFGQVRMRFLSRIQPPLTDKYSLRGTDVLILRDQEYRPIRLGERILVLRGNRAILLNAAANKAPTEEHWAGMVSVDLATAQRYLYSPGQALVCGLSVDGKTVLIADRKSIRGLDIETAKVKWPEKTMAELGVSSLAYMAVGEGVLVAVSSQGKVACVDIASGELKWPATLVSGRLVSGGRTASPRPAGPPDIAAGNVYVRHDNFRSLTCFDLRTGKVIGRWAAKTYLDAHPTEEGMLVMMADGELSIREIMKNDEGRKTFSEPRIHRFGESSGATIVGVSRDRIALRPNRASSEVRFLPMVRKQTLAAFEVTSILGTQAVPVEVFFDGRYAYAVSTTGSFGHPRTVYGRLTSVRGLSVEKYDLQTKKRLWSKVVEPPQRSTSYLLPLGLGRNHLVVSTKSHSSSVPAEAKILDGATGKLVSRIDLRAGGGNTTRLRIIGPPVMTNGRLCVEDSLGLTVYGGR